MDPTLFILGALILVFGSALQSAAGFGYGMFAIPLLVLIGNTAPAAMIIVAFGAALQTIIGLWALRRHPNWWQILWMIVIASALVPVGVWALSLIVGYGPVRIRQTFGVIVLTALALQLAARITPRERVPWPWGALSLSACGFFAGMSGMGGPPVVMWIMAHDWSTQRARATMWGLFLGLFPVQFFFLHQRFGQEVLDGFGVALLLGPFALLGIPPGMWIGHKLSRANLRRASYVVIFAASVYAIVA